MADSGDSAGLGLLILYCGIILVSSLAGGWVPMWVRLTHTRLQVATSLVAGLMLGVGVLHLLPHAWHELRSIDGTAGWLLGGFLTMFFIQRFLYFHHHDVPDDDPEGCTSHSHRPTESLPAPAAVHHDHTLAGKSARQLSWGGALFGLTLHTLIDGFALAASVKVEGHGDAASGLLGLGTFLVIVLHKPFDSMVISTLMTAEGWSKRARHAVNAGFALVIPAGVLMFHLGADIATGAPAFLGASLAFAAGTFLCIATSDLLPELQFHSHDRVKLSVALCLGLAIAAAIGHFEETGHDRHAPAIEPGARPGIAAPGPADREARE